MTRIRILDTTLRDGEQTASVAFTDEEKLTIAKALLIETKVDSIEIASAGASPKEFDAVKKICTWAKAKGILDRVEVLGFVDGSKSIEWINKAGCKVMNLLCKGSEKHLKNQLRKTQKQHVDEINEIISYATNLGLKVNLYLEDVSNGLIDSKEYVFYLLDNIKGFSRILLPDTLGIWTPKQTYEFCSMLTSKYEYSFDFHAHNDYGFAIANSLAAINAGIDRIHTTVNGLGERTGNCNLATIVAVVNDHTKHSNSVTEKNLGNLAKLVESISGIRLSPNTPIVGENVFTQCCGVHADGDKKGNLYCNKLLPERFGGRRAYALGKNSGKASVEKNLEMLGIELDSVAVKKVLDRIVEIGEKKETVSVLDLPYIVSDVLGESPVQNVIIKDFSLQLNHLNKPTASIRIEIDGKQYEDNASGDGQYDAFMKALKKIYVKIGKDMPQLLDYSVRIPPGGKTDALVETVITWENGGRFKTKGVDSDQTSAAIKATLNMLNRANSPKETKGVYKLHNNHL